MLVSILAIVFVLRISKNSDRYAPKLIVVIAIWFNTDTIRTKPRVVLREKTVRFFIEIMIKLGLSYYHTQDFLYAKKCNQETCFSIK